VVAGCDINGTVRGCYRDQGKADNQHVRGQREVRYLLKQRALIVNVKSLILRAAERNITAPLVGHYSRAHCTTDDIEDLRVTKELRGKARRVERHRQKVTIRAAVRFVSMVLEVCEKNRPKRVSTSTDHAARQLRPQEQYPFASSSRILLFAIMTARPNQSADHDLSTTQTKPFEPRTAVS